MAGQRFGQFTIVKKLGEGAQGVVFLARDPAGRQVALKILRRELAGDPEIVGRFRRESTLALQLQSPHVVRAYAAGSEQDRLYVATEFIDGGSVEDLLRKQAPLPFKLAVALLAHLLRGLDAIHRKGLIHRDIKPANMMLTAQRCGKLADLGLARPTAGARTQYTRTGTIVGSPAYMSPEQIETEGELDIRSDLYAAGVFFYECLVGHPPFDGQNILDVLRQHLTAPVPDPRTRRADVPAALADLTMKLLAKSPQERPADPAAAFALLRQAVAPARPRPGQPGQALPRTVDEAAFPRTMPEAPGFAKTEGEEAFPRTMPETPDFPRATDEGSFPGTIPDDEAFPRTLNEEAFPGTMPEQPASAEAAGGGGFPRTLGEAVPETVAEHPRRVPQATPQAPLRIGTPARADWATMGDDRTLPCDAALPQVLKPAADSAARGLPRAKLTWQSGGGTQTLFVYGGNTLQLGRNSDIEGQNGLCLRLRPRQGNEQLIRCISGRHCQFYVRDQRLYLRDTTGRGRTLVNEHVLGDDEELLDTTRLMIAHVLALRARPIPAPLSAPPVVEGALPPEPASILDCKLSDEPDHGPGVVDAESPALWLTRTHNGTEHRYALVPGRLDLKATADGWEPAARGQEPDLELFTAKQQLWLRTADLAEGECLAVADGVQVSGAGLTGSFSPIRAEDQK